MKYTGVMKFKIGWGDCSPSGAVFYPNYFRWFDAGMWNFFDEAGWALKDLENKFGIVGLPLIETHADFKKSCRLHDMIILETKITAFSRKTLNMSHTLIKGDDVIIEAFDVRFWGIKHPEEPSRLKAALIPEEVTNYFDH